MIQHNGKLEHFGVSKPPPPPPKTSVLGLYHIIHGDGEKIIGLDNEIEAMKKDTPQRREKIELRNMYAKFYNEAFKKENPSTKEDILNEKYDFPIIPAKPLRK